MRWHWLLLRAAASLAAQPVAAAPRYDISLSLQPERRQLAVELEASGLTCADGKARLYLNRALTVTRAVVDGAVVTPLIDPPGAPPFWLSRARAIDLPCPATRLQLSYEGAGDALTSDGRNQVSGQLVELSLYGGWYPLQRIDDLPSWRLSTGLPTGWQWASNGTPEGGTGLRLFSARAQDIALVAAPDFERQMVHGGASDVELLLNAGMSAKERKDAQALGQAGADMAGWLRGLLGPVAGTGTATIAFPPRGGSLSYARLPLVVLSKDSLRRDSGRSPLLNIRHEIAHFWSTAPRSDDQWISEGVAEYLAAKRAADTDRSFQRAEFLASYRRMVAEAGPGAILDNGATDGPLGFSARYARPLLLFDRLEQRAGFARVAALLKAAYGLGPELSTEKLLVLVGRRLGRHNRRLVERCLKSTSWPEECGGMRAGGGV